MSEWADGFFKEWQEAWNTGTEAVLELVTDDIEYWDVTLDQPLRGIQEYAGHCDNFFAAFSECQWSMREPVIHEPETDRVTEPWAFTGVNSGPLWIGLPATGRQLNTIGTDIFEFRDGKVCREHSFYDVVSSLRQLGLWPGIGSQTESFVMSLGSAALNGRKALSRLPIPGN
ncbi:MAG: ester cyclase [Solirubrobacterales bacterium]